jgi:hypothetical protein
VKQHILSRPHAYIALFISTITMILVWYGPVVQPSHYHEFADQRSWMNIPHFMDVMSNLPFLFVGIWGFAVASRSASSYAARSAWQVFFIAVAFTCVGSSFYHWAPNDFGLFIDRLPIAWACASLSCALLAERSDARFAQAAPLCFALFAATLSCVYWYLTQRITQGQGDLRPYLFVQFLPMLLVPLCCIAFAPSALTRVSGPSWAVVLGLYAFAKGFEVFDHQILHTVHLISGHSIKHFLAAAAAAYLAHTLSVAKRSEVFKFS